MIKNYATTNLLSLKITGLHVSFEVLFRHGALNKMTQKSETLLPGSLSAIHPSEVPPLYY